MIKVESNQEFFLNTFNCNSQKIRRPVWRVRQAQEANCNSMCIRVEDGEEARQKEESSCLFDGTIKGLFMFISHLKCSHKIGDGVPPHSHMQTFTHTHKHVYVPSSRHKSSWETDRVTRKTFLDSRTAVVYASEWVWPESWSDCGLRWARDRYPDFTMMWIIYGFRNWLHWSIRRC